MKLQRREKMLAGLTLGLIGLAGLWFLFFFGESRSDEQLIADQTKLTDEIKEKEKLVQAAGRDAKRLAEWQRRALPAEPSLARSLYRNWLSSLAAPIFAATRSFPTRPASAATNSRGSRLRSAPGQDWATWSSSCTSSIRPVYSTKSARQT